MKRLRRLLVGQIRALCYASGLLGILHRYRNRNTLTVFMFHRVLPAESAEYARADKEFTFTTAGFERALQFIVRHYAVVDIAAVLSARAAQKPLPQRAALITFDDGWLDTVEHALPLLNKHDLPALMFVTTELLDSEEKRWWQDALVEIQSDPAMTVSLAKDMGLDPDADRLPWRLSAAMAAQSLEQRRRLLDGRVAVMPPQRQMVNAADVIGLAKTKLAIGAHGHSHAPLTVCAASSVELQTSCERIRAVGGQNVMAFPHGACNAHLIDQAHALGFDLVFTSEATLNPARVSAPALGRLHVPENEWTCEGALLSDAKLATYLFFRPVQI